MPLTRVGRFLRDFRIKNGERLYDMAGRIGIGCARLSDIEMGKKPPYDGFIAAVVTEYGLSGQDAAPLHEAARLDAENSPHCEDRKRGVLDGLRGW